MEYKNILKMHNLCNDLIFHFEKNCQSCQKWLFLSNEVDEIGTHEKKRELDSMTKKTIKTYQFFLIKLQKGIPLTKTPNFRKKTPIWIRASLNTSNGCYLYNDRQFYDTIYIIPSSSSLVLLLYKTIIDKWYSTKV